ncbi:hypothetical protein MVEN_01422100 [Mycena venus]|uniref:Uncharacterized protein n=1 Tax=Mycena venus TaxID=2733690 RepID=A0A8H6XZE2_9AGAR|nr:hypothetical protein MVEN_01422100 [Mycena venus]
MTLPRANLIFQAPVVLVITSIILASPLITIFAPSLTTRQASAVNRALTVPTLNLSTDGWFEDINLVEDFYNGPSDTWDKVVLTALTSPEPVGWPMPDGCAPECRYNFTYSAPALRCFDLTADQIDYGADDSRRLVPGRVFQNPPAAYLLNYDTKITKLGGNGLLNFTGEGQYPASSDSGPEFNWTVSYVPFAASNLERGATINAAGATCTFYNATHDVQTHFVNGMQQLSVSVKEFHNTLDISQRSPGGGKVFNIGGDAVSGAVAGARGVAFAPGFGGPLHFFAIADALTARLFGPIGRGIDGTLKTGAVLTDTSNSTEPVPITLVLDTNLFESPFLYNDNLSFTQIFPGMNLSSQFTSLAPRDSTPGSTYMYFSLGLESLVANVSLAYVQMGTGFTTVDAVVAAPGTIYHYNRRTLGATYIAAFACLVGVNALGMFCLIQNGEPSANTFSQLLLATRNSRLDHVADALEVDSGKTSAKDNLRLMFGEVDVPGRGIRAAFGLVGEQKVQVLRQRR